MLNVKRSLKLVSCLGARPYRLTSSACGCVTTNSYNFLSTSPNFTLSSHSQYVRAGSALYDFILSNIVTAAVATFIKR